jgi:hypothetical protein
MIRLKKQKSRPMTISEIYRARAAALADQAKSASAPVFKERFERMALAYERLAAKYAKRVQSMKRKPKWDGPVAGLVESPDRQPFLPCCMVICWCSSP